MDINRTKYILRSLLLQGFWNYKKMQNVGMLFIMYPLLMKLYSSSDRFLRRAMLRNLDTFNTNPAMVSFCLGALINKEKLLSKMQNNTHIFYEQEKEWFIIRSSVATTVASLGDRLFWSTLKPLSLVIAFAGLYLGQVYFLNDTPVQSSDSVILYSLLLAFFAYNIPVFIIRYRSFALSYKGTEEDFFGLINFNWNRLIIILKTIGQVLTLFVFVYGIYLHFANAVPDAYVITKVALLSAFIVLSVFIKKWNIPNLYLYLGSVLVFTLVALFS